MSAGPTAFVEGEDYEPRKTSARFVKGRDYKRGDKYQSLREHRIQTSLRPKQKLVSKHGWVELHTNGELVVKKGYCWDGPSGPTFDTASTMRASLFHDALYQLMRELLLSVGAHRRLADELLRRVMIADGAWEWRADFWLWTVWRFAKGAAIA